MNYFLLCAYNEEKNIDKVINSICEKFFVEETRIIVVDDGSIDGTNCVLENLKLKFKNLIVLSHKRNLGLGMALRTGFDYLINFASEDDIIITMDADNTHPVEVSQYMIKKIFEGNDIVIASRYQKGGSQVGVSIVRASISFLAKVFLKKIFNLSNVKDYTSGYRAYKAEIVKKAKNFYGEKFLQEKDFVIQLEILYKLSKFNPKITEVPLVLRYDKKHGKSKLKIVKNIFKYFSFILKTKFL